MVRQSAGAAHDARDHAATVWTEDGAIQNATARLKPPPGRRRLRQRSSTGRNDNPFAQPRTPLREGTPRSLQADQPLREIAPTADAACSRVSVPTAPLAQEAPRARARRVLWNRDTADATTRGARLVDDSAQTNKPASVAAYSQAHPTRPLQSLDPWNFFSGVGAPPRKSPRRS